jgi:hypothetical protein
VTEPDPDIPGTRVQDRPARGLPLGGGGCTAVFGLPFLLVGLGAMALGWTRAGQDVAGAGMLGTLFASAGGWLVWRGLRGALGAWRRARLQRRFPREPWRGDYPWRPAGEPAASSGAVGCLFFCAWVVGLLSLFVWRTVTQLFEDPQFVALWEESRWQAFTSSWVPETARWAAGFAALFAFLGLLTVGNALWHGLRYGRGRFEFAQFPYFVGEPLLGRLRIRAPSQGYDKLTLRLRFIEERAEPGDRRGSNTINVYECWGESREYDKAALPRGRTLELPVRFTPHHDPRLVTLLSGLPPRYWVLEVHGDAPGLDYRASFLLPVYARPGAV